MVMLLFVTVLSNGLSSNKVLMLHCFTVAIYRLLLTDKPARMFIVSPSSCSGLCLGKESPTLMATSCCSASSACSCASASRRGQAVCLKGHFLGQGVGAGRRRVDGSVLLPLKASSCWTGVEGEEGRPSGSGWMQGSHRDWRQGSR